MFIKVLIVKLKQLYSNHILHDVKHERFGNLVLVHDTRECKHLICFIVSLYCLPILCPVCDQICERDGTVCYDFTHASRIATSMRLTSFMIKGDWRFMKPHK